MIQQKAFGVDCMRKSISSEIKIALGEVNPKALLQVDDIYRSLVKVTSNSVYMADKKCQYLYVNPKHCARIGLQ
jgi:hypothetical protein